MFGFHAVLASLRADPASVLAALGRAQGRLRCEVAASIRRKRVPGLLFRLAGPEDLI